MKILVTGGAGYIGSITTRMLLDSGHECVVLDTLEKGHEGAVDTRAHLVVGDVGDRDVLDAVLPGCESVMHLAGYIDVAESQSEPESYFANNAIKPRVMLKAMVRHRVPAIVFSSTAAVYGEGVEIPITESASTAPVSAYGASKLAFELELESFEAAYGLRTVRFRYFNAAGAWEDGSMGEAHDPETHLIPRVLRAMAAGEREFEVYGNDYRTADGTCVRDYIHVCDLGRAHRLALEQLGVGGAPGTGGIFNLGNGIGFSNLEVVRMCAEVTGRDVEVKYGPRRPGDTATLVASPDLARKQLGWEPERGDLRTIVEDAWRWHSEHPGGYA